MKATLYRLTRSDGSPIWSAAYDAIKQVLPGFVFATPSWQYWGKMAVMEGVREGLLHTFEEVEFRFTDCEETGRGVEALEVLIPTTTRATKVEAVNFAAITVAEFIAASKEKGLWERREKTRSIAQRDQQQPERPLAGPEFES